MMQSGPGALNAQPFRDTQRVPRSCLQCSRRKIKCTKRVPCEPCVRRGESALCGREVVRVNGKVTVALDPVPSIDSKDPGDLVNENHQLRARIEQLEEVLAARSDTILSLPIESSNLRDEPNVPQPPEDVVKIFEGLHLGRPAEGAIDNSEHLSQDANQHILSLLPIRQSSSKIIHFSLHFLGWVHCAVNAPRFMAEHDVFWNALELNDHSLLQNHGWLSVYLSLLAVGAYFMDDAAAKDIHYIHEGFSGLQAPDIPPSRAGLLEISFLWYGAALKQMHRSNFLSKPLLSTVQTLAILMLLHRNFGESHREYFLLGLAINTARTLGLDYLKVEGSRSQYENKPIQSMDQSDQELGRRLWWTLVICDWMTVFSRPSSITLGSFSSRLSIQSDRSHQDVVLKGTSIDLDGMTLAPSPLEYHITVSKIAYVVHTHVRRSHKSPANISMALREIDRIAGNLPTHLKLSDEDETRPQYVGLPWVTIQRIQLATLFEVCRIDLCFSCLPHRLEVGEDEFSLQAQGLRAAARIVNLHCRDVSKLTKKFWGTSASLIAAGVFLILDLICFKRPQPETSVVSTLETINDCVQMLQEMVTPKINGSSVLKRLLSLYERDFPGCAVDKQILLEIMSLAAIPVTNHQNLDDALAFQGEGQIFFDEAILDSDKDHSLVPTSDHESSDTILTEGFGSANFFYPFDSGFTMDLNYLNFDADGENGLPGLNFAALDTTLSRHT